MGEHAVFAALYDRMMAPSERAGLADRRRRLLSRASGRVLEIGGGTGANLPHYRDVESVTILEPDRAMLRRLADRVTAAAVPVELHEAGIEDAALPDAAFDTVVSTLTLCSVDDPDRALASVRRLLAPGGTFLFVEHVAGTGLRRRVQRLAAPLWRRLAGGCHPDRDTLAAIGRAGFVVAELDRFPMPRGNPVIRPCVQGVAR
jgi:SAM-dependent methyltransferase